MRMLDGKRDGWGRARMVGRIDFFLVWLRRNQLLAGYPGTQTDSIFDTTETPINKWGGISSVIPRAVAHSRMRYLCFNLVLRGLKL